MPDNLRQQEINGGQVLQDANHETQLEIPRLPEKRYGLAQVDNYMHLPRRQFPYQPPVCLQLEAKVSGEDLPGTWGFGLWNDPFSFGFGAGGMARFLPVLPNAAWFFYGSHQNYLSLHDDQPACGFHMKTFRSSLLPSCLSLLAIPALPLLLWPASARYLRLLSRSAIQEDARALFIDTDSWHTFRLDWKTELVVFEVDQQEVFCTPVSPCGRLGLVIWIDNQYFRYDPSGKLGFGFLKTPTAQSLWIRNITINGERGV